MLAGKENLTDERILNLKPFQNLPPYSKSIWLPAHKAQRDGMGVGINYPENMEMRKIDRLA